jgi:hypothetical protein
MDVLDPGLAAAAAAAKSMKQAALAATEKARTAVEKDASQKAPKRSPKPASKAAQRILAEEASAYDLQHFHPGLNNYVKSKTGKAEVGYGQAFLWSMAAVHM